MAHRSIRGRFVWHELETDDPAAGEAFYKALVGWDTMTDDPGGGPYTMFTQDGVPAAGVMDLPEEAKQMGAIPCWLPYVGVEDVDAAVAQATALGAIAPMESFDVPAVGRIGLIIDPQGAALGLFAPAGDDPPANPPPGVGTTVWHELATTDYEAAFRFYEQIFGWAKVDVMDMGERRDVSDVRPDRGRAPGRDVQHAARDAPSRLEHLLGGRRRRRRRDPGRRPGRPAADGADGGPGRRAHHSGQRPAGCDVLRCTPPRRAR